MSWDVFIQDLPDVPSMGDIPDDYKPKIIGKREDIIHRIKEIVPMADFSDPAWGVLEGDGFSVEFNMGEEEEIDSIACHVRGVSGGGACVAEIVRHLGLKAFDTGVGEFLDLDNPELGFEKWKAFRDKCLKGNR